jgi:DNA-binding NtrC family response regulator
MDGRRARVLVIDDDPRLGRLTARMLEREHEVAAVTSAREALVRIGAGESFDLVLCDVMMPELTGVDFHERLPLIAPHLLDRVVYMTGGVFTPDAVAFFKQASIRRLEKPLGVAELRAAVREHLLRLGRKP